MGKSLRFAMISGIAGIALFALPAFADDLYLLTGNTPFQEIVSKNSNGMFNLYSVADEESVYTNGQKDLVAEAGKLKLDPSKTQFLPVTLNDYHVTGTQVSNQNEFIATGTLNRALVYKGTPPAPGMQKINSVHVIVEASDDGSSRTKTFISRALDPATLNYSGFKASKASQVNVYDPGDLNMPYDVASSLGKKVVEFAQGLNRFPETLGLHLFVEFDLANGQKAYQMIGSRNDADIGSYDLLPALKVGDPLISEVYQLQATFTRLLRKPTDSAVTVSDEVVKPTSNNPTFSGKPAQSSGNGN